MNIEKINNWFARRGKSIIKRRWLILSLFVIIFAICLWGLKSLILTASWSDYFLEDDPMLVKTDEFKSIFGNDNFAAVLTTCDNTFTKENLELIRELSNEMLDSIPYADKITSITNVEFMVGTEDGMSIEQIVPEIIPSDSAGLNKIKNMAYIKPYISERLISKDGTKSWILLKLHTFPPDSVWHKDNKSIAPDVLTGTKLYEIISKDKYSGLNPKGTGMPYLTIRKMDWINTEMPKILGLATLFSIIILIIFTRSFRGVIVPLITAVSSIIIVYGTLGLFHYSVDSSMLLIPMLLAFAVSIAYNIHIYSYFRRQFLYHGNRKLAIEETIAEIGWPTLFSSLTTFAALLSFLTIPMKPMHFVGIATSSCVLLSFFISITLMPTILSFGKDGKINYTVNKTGKRKFDNKMEKFGKMVLKRSTIIIIIFSVITAFLLFEFKNIETAFDVERTMGKRTPYIRELLDVTNSELGSLYSYDIMIEFPEDGDAKLPENLKKLDKLQSHVKSYKSTKRTTTILNILKDLNQTLHENNNNYYSIPDNQNEIAQLLLLYENAGGSEAEYWMDYDYKRLRLMVEISNYNSGETERNLNDIVNKAQSLFPNANITTVGSLPQFTVMMQYVVRGQIASFGVALIIIGILMMIVFGNVRIGLIGLIPNITPAIVVGGLMGLLRYPLDMMTATIMPMILGLAVDDTIHFINHGHLEFNRCKSYDKAILKTFRTVGSPIILTSAVMGANFLVYTTSQSSSFIHMGILSLAGIISALLADLFITPILFKKFKIFGKEDENNCNK